MGNDVDMPRRFGAANQAAYPAVGTGDSTRDVAAVWDEKLHPVPLDPLGLVNLNR